MTKNSDSFKWHLNVLCSVFNSWRKAHNTTNIIAPAELKNHTLFHAAFPIKRTMLEIIQDI